MGGTCRTYGEERGAYMILVGDLRVKKLFGIPRRRY